MTETETVNPYTPPPATSTPPVDEYCDVPIVSVRGRIGRLRFLAYGMGLNVVMTLLVGAVAAATTALSESAGAIVTVAALVLVYGGALLLLVFWTIRRVHDCNLNGWFTLLFMVPPIGLALWFVPGTQGENRYGLGPPPNRAGLIVLALLMLFVAVLGILAAIAIPAYQDYTVRTKIQGSVNLASPARRNLDLACREQSLQAGMRNAERRARARRARCLFGPLHPVGGSERHRCGSRNDCRHPRKNRRRGRSRRNHRTHRPMR